ATYPILNLVHLYISILKQMFALRIDENETVNSYLNLIYSSLMQVDILENAEDKNDSSSISNDNDISTAKN
ncbi:299_t:CDS:1, partial [Cetraspora pellucida]